MSGEIVAVKVLVRQGAPEMARFEREARVLAELNHPGIVRYVTHGASPSGELYLVMEWLDGEDLHSRLRRTGLTVEESIPLAIRIADALGAAHSCGIIHRDLKPSNLFLAGGQIDRVKLLDFGVARLGDATKMTQAGLLIGTPGYMAPEQARGEEALDARADVFSLGCVLYECLTGSQPFKGDHLMAVLAKILCAEPTRVIELRSGVSQDLDSLVMRMLAKERDERPHDGAAVAAALVALQTTTRPSSDAPQPAQGPAALTTSERRALSVVLISSEPAGENVLREASGETPAPAVENALRKAAESCGGRLEPLLDGSMLVTHVDHVVISIGYRPRLLAKA